MATNSSIKNQMTEQKSSVPQTNSVKGLLESPAVKKRFEDLLDNKAAGFTSSLITLINNDGYLADANPMSIIAGAMQAAQLDLPIEKQFGFAYLVPFNERNKHTGQFEKKAQFVLGYRGYIQLAQRSGQYKSINVGTIYEGQLKSWNPLTETLDFDPDGKTSDAAVGYFGYFKLLNGFEKTVYWTKEEIEKHRKDNQKGQNKGLTGVWASNYDAMAQKTVLRNLLSKWGLLSVEIQNAVVSDENSYELDEEKNIKVAEPWEEDIEYIEAETGDVEDDK